MYSRTELLEIISGQRTGILPAIVRTGLGCLTPVYRTVVGFRNRKFNRAIRQNDQSVVYRAGLPVISIGNLTTGGTGKTPHVIFVARHLRKNNHRVVLISRGYGSDSAGENSGRNDEAMELEHRLPDVPHLQDPDRVSMTTIACEELESQIAVLDDAFQHRQLHRDLDVVLIDATEPFGFGRLLPRGLLREPISSLNRADVIIVSRVDLVEPGDLQQTIKQIQACAGNRLIAQTRTMATELLQSDGTVEPIEKLKDLSLFLFCGIGNPDNFKNSIVLNCKQIVGCESFQDHHIFTREDLELIGQQAADGQADAILCTHKDLVKVGTNRINGIPVFAVVIDVVFESGQAEFEAHVDQVANLIGQPQE